MSKPSNVANSAFILFAQETKRRLEAQGQVFPNGLEDANHIAADLWSKMTDEQKNVYRQKASNPKKMPEFHDMKMAKRANRCRVGQHNADPKAGRPSYKEETLRVFPPDEESAMAEMKKKSESDQETLYMYLSWNLSESPNAILNEPFHVISVLHHGRTPSHTYFPAEVAVVEMTLGGGIRNEHLFFLGPYDFSPAFRHRAAAIDAEHGIRFGDTIPGMISDFASVMVALENVFINCRKPLLFCIKNDYNAVQGSIHFLRNQAESNGISGKSILCIEDLFAVLCRWKGKTAISEELNYFNKCDGRSESVFKYWKGLTCDYHGKFDNCICALATAKRACFFFLRCINSYFNLKMTPNHRPQLNTENESVSAEAMAAHFKLDGELLKARAAMTNQSTDEASASRSPVRPVQDIVSGSARMQEESAEDMCMPSTLPSQLRELYNCSAPLAWSEGQHVLGTVNIPNNSSDNVSVAHVESDLAMASISYPESEFDESSEINVIWGENWDLRRKIYSERGIKLFRDY